MNFEPKIELIDGVGKVLASRLKQMGILTIKDLVYHFPYRYEDYSVVKKINELNHEDVVTIKAKVELIANRRSWKKRKVVTEAIVDDGSDRLKIVWFNQPFLIKNIKAGDEIFLSGKVEINNYGTQMVSPSYEKSTSKTIHTARLVSIYPLTQGITAKQFRFLLQKVLLIIKQTKEFLPIDIIERNDFFYLNQALEQIHFPQSHDSMIKAKKRLQFDELFLVQLRIYQAKMELKKSNAPRIKFLEKPTVDFVKSLAFELTTDQKKTAWQIIQDMEFGKPMNRLLEGDVGSGKTVVAALVMQNVILNGYKCIVMAPTEILATQHFETLKKMFDNHFRVGIFTRSQRIIGTESLNKNLIKQKMKNGEFDVVIGTQALIQESVEIKDLGLVIIDEQHRFGVGQRKKLQDKGQKLIPHFLSMTATPIPRTLALALYSDLDLCIIKSMPKGRKQIVSRLVEEINRVKAYDFIKQQVMDGRQVFVICPLIDESDTLGVKSVTAEFKKLTEEIFPQFNIGLLHGKLKSEQKDSVMQGFINKKIDILVSTSVIEVGIDVPNATIMMIEGADRFGLAQLHQFRGRVGRGEHQSYCLLFSDNSGEKTVQRLKYFVECKDGFELAEKDLELRGAGEVYGFRQSGMPEMKVADLLDAEMISLVQTEVGEFFKNNKIEDYPDLLNLFRQKNIIIHFE